MEPLLIVLGIGALGGAIRSILGYEVQSDAAEAFSYIKFGKSVVRAAIVGASVVLAATELTQSDITSQTYILAFFTAVGSDVLTKEGTKALGVFQQT